MKQQLAISKTDFSVVPAVLVRHHLGMRRWATFVFSPLLFLASAFAQNWKAVHKADDAKWAKATGLDPTLIHRFWRSASTVPDEKDDDSRIANLDVEGLAERREVLLATYAGEHNCLTITVFRRLTEQEFKKIWAVREPPDDTGFCDTNYGTASADASDGVIFVRVPHSFKDGVVTYNVYAYDWNGITYRFAAQKEVQGDH